MNDNKVCGNCKYNKCEYNGYNSNKDFYCDNSGSENYGVPTFYDDSCEDWEEKC